MFSIGGYIGIFEKQQFYNVGSHRILVILCYISGTYTFIDSGKNKVITFQLVQTNETGSANRNELAGLQRAVDKVGHGNIASIVTDR